MLTATDRMRRYGGVARLYGEAALARLADAHVLVVGIGGVGSWAAEALARSGVGRLSLVDLDHVAESNINRQVHALESTLGRAKIDVMAERIADIAPDCTVSQIEEFVAPDNLDACVPADADFLIDAIDAPRAKAALIAHALQNRLAMLVCGGAGGRTDPLRLRRDDLSRTRNDALLASVRSRLRREHGFPPADGRCFGVPALYSEETLAAGARPDEAAAPGAPLACAGYGSIVTVTAPMGFAAAAFAIGHLAREIAPLLETDR